MNKLRNQLDNVLKDFDGQPSSAIKLKAQTIIIYEQLATLTPDNKSLLVAIALRPTSLVTPLTHHAFCCAVILSKFCGKFHYHSHYCNELISAALTMRVGLDLADQRLSSTIYQRKKLNVNQQKHYRLYPLHSANYLHKAKVVTKNAIYTILQHQELLDGSGYPKQLSAHHISHGGQLLALVNKLVELATPRHQRAPFGLNQSLSYLARRPQLYNQQLLTQLICCLTSPTVGLAMPLSADGIGLIEDVDIESGVNLLVQRFEEIDGQLQRVSTTTKHEYSNELTLQFFPSNVSDSEYYRNIEHSEVARTPDASQSVARLKPAPNLARLLEALDSFSPEQDIIAQHIESLPSLGNDLIESLSRQYPNRQFNNSFHALQMVGFVQSRPLLCILALRHQLSFYQFPALATLECKVDTALSAARHISEFTSDVLPHQLAMFALINVAPLYLDRRVHQTNLPERVDLDNINPLQAAGLFGLTANPKQAQLINTLAKLWESNNYTKQLLLRQNDLANTKSRFQHELVLGYQLALILTQHIYHDLSFEHPGVNAHLKAICRKLKISTKQLKQLIEQTLASAPRCPLGSF